MWSIEDSRERHKEGWRKWIATGRVRESSVIGRFGVRFGEQDGHGSSVPLAANGVPRLGLVGSCRSSFVTSGWFIQSDGVLILRYLSFSGP